MTRPERQEMFRVAILTRLAPSNIPTWLYPRAAGDQFTVMQLNEMRYREVDPATVGIIKVRVSASMSELWWPTGNPAPVYLLECPIVRKHHDGRVLVIAPSGERKLVWPDGHIRRPKHERRAA